MTLIERVVGALQAADKEASDEGTWNSQSAQYDWSVLAVAAIAAVREWPEGTL